MVDYTITITDPMQIAAITEARDRFNTQIQNVTITRPGSQNISPPPIKNTNQEYLQMIIDNQVNNFVQQFGFNNTVIAAKQAELDTLRAKFAAAEAAVGLPVTVSVQNVSV